MVNFSVAVLLNMKECSDFVLVFKRLHRVSFLLSGVGICERFQIISKSAKFFAYNYIKVVSTKY